MKRLAIFLVLAASLAAAQTVHINDDGTLREISGIFVNDDGTLRDIQEGFINDDGVLRQFFTAIVLSAGDGGTLQVSDPAVSYGSRLRIRFNTDGTVDTSETIDSVGANWISAGTWIEPTSEASSSYDVRFTNCSISTDSIFFTVEAAIEDTWIDLGTNREWNTYKTNFGGRNFNCDFEVRTNGGAPPATGTVNWEFAIVNS